MRFIDESPSNRIIPLPWPASRVSILRSEYDDDYCHSTTCVPLRSFTRLPPERERSGQASLHCSPSYPRASWLRGLLQLAALALIALLAAEAWGVSTQLRLTHAHAYLKARPANFRPPLRRHARGARPAYLPGEDPRQCARSQSGFHDWFFNNLRKHTCCSTRLCWK